MTGLSKMNTSEKLKPCKLVWFRFYPQDFFKEMKMTDEEAGKRFKELIMNLGSNQAPAGSVEERMIEEARTYSDLQRQRVMNRWNKNKEDEEPQEPPPEPPQSQEMRRPPRPRIPTPARPKKPTLEEVYDYCDTIGTPPPIGREWYEWQESKGWNNITSTWQAAFRAFASKKG